MKRASSNTNMSSASTKASGSSPLQPFRSVFRKGSIGQTEASPLFVQPRINVQPAASAFGLIKYAKSRDKHSINSTGGKGLTRQDKAGLRIQVSGSHLELLAGIDPKPTKFSARIEEASSKLVQTNVGHDLQVSVESKSPQNGNSSPENCSPGASGNIPNKFRVTDGSVIDTPLARACSPNSSLARKAASAQAKTRSRMLRSPVRIESETRKNVDNLSTLPAVSATTQIRSTMSRLLRFLSELNPQPDPSHGLALQKPKEVSGAVSAALDTPDSAAIVTIANGESPQQPGLKDLLLDPDQAGKELTVSQFRRLESQKLNQTLKSCLKPPNIRRQSSLLGLSSHQETSIATLKRAVSFSENVVMFIYQA